MRIIPKGTLQVKDKHSQPGLVHILRQAGHVECRCRSGYVAHELGDCAKDLTIMHARAYVLKDRASPYFAVRAKYMNHFRYAVSEEVSSWHCLKLVLVQQQHVPLLYH